MNTTIIPVNNIVPISETMCQEKLLLCSQRVSNWTAGGMNEAYATIANQFQYLIIAMAVFSIGLIVIRWLLRFGKIPQKWYDELTEGFTTGLVVISFIFIGMAILT